MSTCPSIYELTEGDHLSPQLLAHVSRCPRCGALRATWEAQDLPDEDVQVDDVPEVSWPHAAYPDVDADPAPGAVHSIWGPESGELLTVAIVDVDEREALVLPITPDVQLAGDWDILLDDDVLPYPAAAQVWNHLNVLREQLLEQLSILPSLSAGALDRAVDAFLSDSPLPSELRQGPELLTPEDPRHAFRDAEAARAREFTEPWRLLYAASTLGGVLRSRREDYELELPDLSADVDLDPDRLSRLEEDREDLHAYVPVPTMERLVTRLDLPPSNRLQELIGTAVFENMRSAPPDVGATRARRRRGLRSAVAQPPEQLRREVAEGYVARVMQRLEEHR